MPDSTRPATEEDWVYWQKLVSDEHDRQVAENDRLRNYIVTLEAMLEPSEDRRKFHTVEALMTDLNGGGEETI